MYDYQKTNKKASCKWFCNWYEQHQNGLFYYLDISTTYEIQTFIFLTHVHKVGMGGGGTRPIHCNPQSPHRHRFRRPCELGIFRINAIEICSFYVWRRIFSIGLLIFKSCQCMFAISLLSHLGKVHHTWILFPRACFVPSLIEIGPVVLGKIFNLR